MTSARYIGSHNINEILRAEKEKRKRARLLQVRHQAQGIATDIRKAVSAEKHFQLQALEGKIQTNFTRNKERHLTNQQQKYSRCLNAVGEGQRLAPFMERAKQHKLEMEAEASHTAKNRGITAMKVQQSKQKEAVDLKTAIIRKRQGVRAIENDRAAVVASLPAPLPDPLNEALARRGIPPVFRDPIKSLAKPKSSAQRLAGSTQNFSPKSPVLLTPKKTMLRQAKSAEVLTPKFSQVLTGSLENIASPNKTARFQNKDFQRTANKENTFSPHDNKIDKRTVAAIRNDLKEHKTSDNSTPQRQGRKIKGYVSKKMNIRRSVNKRRSSIKNSFSRPSPEKKYDELPKLISPRTVVCGPALSKKPGRQIKPISIPSIEALKEDSNKVMAAEALSKPFPPIHDLHKPQSSDAKVNVQKLKDNFAVRQEDLHLLQECESLLNELEADRRKNQTQTGTINKLEDLVEMGKKQLFMDKESGDALNGISNGTGTSGIGAVEPSFRNHVPFDFTVSASSPSGGEAASILNTCRIEDGDESADSSPDLALRLGTRHFFPSVYSDNLMLQNAPESVTTSRRICVDIKKQDEVIVAEPPITITTTIKKSNSTEGKASTLSIGTTVKRCGYHSPDTETLKSSQSLNPPHNIADFESPCFTRSPQTIRNFASAYQQHIMSHSAPVQYASAPVQYASAPVQYASAPVQYASAPVQYASAPVQYASAPVQYASAPVPQNKKDLNMPAYKTRLVHSCEQVKTSDNSQGAILKSKSLDCGLGTSGTVAYEKCQLESIGKLPEQANFSTLPKQVPQTTNSIPLSPEFTQVTAADARCALARVLASRKTPNKTQSDSKPMALTPTENLLSPSSNGSLCLNSTPSVEPTSDFNCNRKPTWDEVFRASQSIIDPATIPKQQTALMISDAKIRQCQSERQKIEMEQQELYRQLNQLRMADPSIDTGVDDLQRGQTTTSAHGNNFGTNCQQLTDKCGFGSNSHENLSLSDASIASSSSPEFCVRPRPPATLPRGMDRTPHELSTIWEADTPHSVHTSLTSEIRCTLSRAAPYFYKTKLQKLTGLVQPSFVPSDNFLTTDILRPGPCLATSPVADEDSTQLASTPKRMSQFCLSSLGDGPGIMEQSEVTLVDSETMSATGFFTPPDYLPSKFVEFRNLGISDRLGSSRLMADLQGANEDSSPSRGSRQLFLNKWANGRDDKLSPLTPKLSDNSVSESLLSFEKHELSTTSTEGLSPVCST